jgi:ketosteroid isomerase-like protein
MTTQEIANRFYELTQQGKFEQIHDELFSKKAVSIEPEHAQGLKTVSGMDQIKQKGKDWNQMVQEMHGGTSSEPQVAGNHFTVAMTMDVTMKGQPRMKMDEICLYEVKDGKIVKEQFFY